MVKITKDIKGLSVEQQRLLYYLIGVFYGLFFSVMINESVIFDLNNFDPINFNFINLILFVISIMGILCTAIVLLKELSLEEKLKNHTFNVEKNKQGSATISKKNLKKDYYSDDELEFLKRKGIDIAKLKSRWEWVYLYPNLSLDFYKEVLYQQYNRVPKRDEIDQMGYRGFRHALKKSCSKTINDLIKEAGHKTYFEIKYANLTFEQLVDLFKRYIYPDLKERYLIDDNSTLKQDHLMYGGYRGVLDRLQKLNKTFNDLIIAVGLKPNKIFLYKGKNFGELVDLFDKELYPQIRKKYSLDKNETPKYDQARELFPGFKQKLSKEGISINDIFKELNLKPNYEYLYDGKSYIDLQNMFLDEILPDLQEKFELDDLIPLYEEVEKEYRGFLAALKKFDKTYLDLILDLGFEPRLVFESILGKTIHNVLKYLISMSINGKHAYDFYTETKIFSDNNLTIDGFINLNNSFLTEFNLNMMNFVKTIENSKIINKLNKFIDDINYRMVNLLFDYSNGYFIQFNQLNLELIARKIIKYKKLPNSFLILVATNWITSDLFKKLPSKIKYDGKIIDAKDVMLISPYLFANIVGLKAQEIDNLKKILKHNINKDLDKLREILEKLEQDKNIVILTTEDLLINRK